ncbi:lysophospholipid transporter LplT [Oxalobacter vibrioformis]|uniref:Lysophospholipid transporter LplT n=1 Tax=Oxalobacter vibrioformis TaxID=933080 RepID=A0A9E9LXU6_9BURK|nr:lysophospholipid transporter LplT [Oxalobacter vibrioformis]WAW10271.1 lysophospholipid transporter LplT [Oxalobacter vibrioformis]
MRPGFYNIMAAEFFSSLADNTLLLVAISMLAEIHAPDWMTPMLRQLFVLSYVGLAAFVGAFADSMPKGRVMFITNAIKIFGCSLFFIGVHPLLAYCVVGFGAAAYSPAKYGIITEFIPPEKLVMANGWLEGMTVTSIILGTVLGGILINFTVSTWLLEHAFPFLELRSTAALMIVMFIYGLAAAFNLRIPDTGARYERQPRNPILLFKGFYHSFTTLWKDKLGQISLAVTTLFWGAGATLQFIVLKWAGDALGLTLDKAAFLQGIFAIGVIAGAIGAARLIPLKKSLNVMWLGMAMGFVVMIMTLVTSIWVAYPLLILIGLLAGFFVVPMNALLQHRGHVLLSAGHSIAVQNFNENLSIVTMLMMYGFMIMLDLDIHTIIVIFGLFVAATMFAVIRWHAANQKVKDSLYLIGEHKH